MKSRRTASNCSTTGRKDRWSMALLVIVAAITVFRATYIEAPHIEQRTSFGLADYQIISLVLSTVLLVCWGLFITVRIARDRLCWRKTWFGAASVIFLGAGILAAASASNHRAALTDLATLIAPIASAALLVQLLNSRLRIRLMLFLILATGAAAAVVSADQFFSSNEALIADYESNPQAHLQKLGIESGSLEQWMYEHRLYSEGVRGLLLTGNSAATFFVLAAFAGIGLCADGAAGLRRLKDKQQKEHTLAAVICYALVTAICAAGLWMTQSKGGIGAMAIGLALFAVLALCGSFIWKHRRLFALASLLLIAAAGIEAVRYGLQHGRLPGGNSMLVRWQYWTSAAQMVADHPLTGVGGGNFSVFYPAYKIPAASETVQDPHNWVLSLLSQYGPLGLLAFMAAALGPLYAALRHRFAFAPRLPDLHPSASEHNLRAWMFIAATALWLFARPFAVGTELLFSEDTRSAIFGYILLYMMPAGVFAAVFFLLAKAEKGDESCKLGQPYLTIALMCGVLAVLIHNLIDFAIFEPGVWGCLWLLTAALAANIHNESLETRPPVMLSPSWKTAATLGLFILIMTYFLAAVIGPLKANHFLGHAVLSEHGRPDWIQKAIDADPLSPDAAYKAAALFAHAWHQTDRPDERLAQEALQLADIAHRRNPADFKPFRLQADVFSRWAAQTQGPKKQQRLLKALERYERALDRYPGSDRLHFDAALTAEAAGQFETALRHYKAAVEIENDYRAQFRIMYPEETQVISRLGQANYQTAKEKIRLLSLPKP